MAWVNEGNIGPHSDWVINIPGSDPNLAGSFASPEYPIPKDMPAKCVKLYETVAKKQPGFARFSCAVAPSGDVWAVVTAMEPVKGGHWSSIPGYWQLVRSNGGSVSYGPPQTFSCFTGGPCDEKPSRCFSDTCHGRLPGGGFWFHDLDADGSLEVFLHGIEEVNTSDVDEGSITLWQRTGSSIRLHPLSQSVSIVGVADCNGDGKLELAVNPYRVAGDDFSVTFGLYNRKTAPEWTLLFEQRKDGSFDADTSELVRAYAKRLCPSPVSAPFRARASAWPRELHCAKLWNAPVDRLEAELEAACASPVNQEARDLCESNRDSLDHMIRTPLPLGLERGEKLPPLPQGCFDSSPDDP